MSDLPNFDELVKLAQEDPEALEALRQEHINKIIDNATPSYQNRLRGLQFQIDANRKIHSDSPMGSCMKISQMMHESFADMRGWLIHLSGLNDPLRDFAEDIESKPTEQANILAFPSS